MIDLIKNEIDLDKLAQELELLELNYKLKTTEEEHIECESDLYAYMYTAWNLFDAAPFKPSWHLEAVCEHVQACLEGEIPDLIVNIPPRCSKSSIVSVAAPTWQWGPRGKPETKFLTMSYGADLSTRDSMRSRWVITSKWYRERWGKVFKLASDANLKTRYENDKLGNRIASSVGGVGTGEGYDVLIVDDPLNASKSASEAELDNVIDWWKGTISTRANDPETARRIVIMQRLSERDLVGHIESNESDGWTVLKLPMRYEPKVWVSKIGWEDPRKVEGELLSPTRFNEKAVNKIEKQLGPYQAAAQLQQRPTPQGGGIIKDKWFRYFYSPQQHYDLIFQSWDLSFDDTKNADFVVGGVWGKIKGDRFLFDVVRDRLDVVGQCEAIGRMFSKWPSTRTVLIENKANGPAVIKLLKSREMIKKLGVQVTGITAVDPKQMGGSKEERLLKCVSEFSGGNVWFMHPDLLPVITDVEKELTQFPKAVHDDCVDMVSYALNWVSETMGTTMTTTAPIQERSAYDSASLSEEEKIQGFRQRLLNPHEDYQVETDIRDWL
jgi:predicted phage terminase large subunit-like protein